MLNEAREAMMRRVAHDPENHLARITWVQDLLDEIDRLRARVAELEAKYESLAKVWG